MASDEMDLKLLQLSIADPSITNEKLGEVVGLSRDAVCRRKQREGYQELLKESTESLQDQLKRMSQSAIDELEVLLTSPDPHIKLSAIITVLKYFPSENKLTLNESQNLNSQIVAKIEEIERKNKELSARGKNES